jgi:hypothetical protein
LILPVEARRLFPERYFLKEPQNMNRLIAFSAVCAISVGSALPLQAESFVSVLQVIEEMGETPYECDGYDPATQSCSGLSYMRTEEGIIYNASWFAIENPAGEPWVFLASSEYEFLFGWGCPSNWGQAPTIRYVDGGDPDLGPQYAELIQSQLNESYDPDAPCAGYYPDGPQRYRIEYRYRNGELAERPDSHVRFFFEPKELRP